MATALQKGFTLVEILVVLSLFAILVVIASTGLFAVISANKSMQINSSRLAQLQVAITLMGRDIEQAVYRPILDEVGNVVGPLVANDEYLELTHAGIVNPLAQSTRSTMQRVAYMKSHTQLIRQTWSALDRGSASLSSKRVLIDNIDSLQFRFLDNHLQVSTKWPLPDPLSNMLPRAIEIKLIMPKSGEIRRLFYLPAQIPVNSTNQTTNENANK